MTAGGGWGGGGGGVGGEVAFSLKANLCENYFDIFS